MERVSRLWWAAVAVLLLWPGVVGAGSIEGILLDSSGKPVDGEVVFLRADRAGGEDGWVMPEEAATDKEGRFRFEEVEAGAYQIESVTLLGEMNPDRPYWMEKTRPVLVDVPEGDAPVEVELADARGGSVVVDLEGFGKATVEGGCMALLRDPSGAADHAVQRVGEERSFRFDRVEPGKHIVWYLAGRIDGA
ncbi:MAG: carboxypeptidase-like regulatory domain-containing protein [Candidatus Bipolaricaulota bacterium]